MLEHTQRLLRDKGTELVFALVAPVGADLDWLERELSAELRLYGYEPNPIRLSALLKAPDLGFDLKDEPEVDRVNSYMDAGNELRRRTTAGEILALWAVNEIRAARVPADESSEPIRLHRTAHILRSIKHPDEARALRAVYGPGFFLIGFSASTSQRIQHLRKKGMSQVEAEDVIKRDAGEENDYGQQTRDAFQLADVFIREEPEHQKTTQQLERFLQLVFGAPHVTPAPDEHAMFLAYASSLRSGDLSRQVGAVVWRDGIGVVATGGNDVPASGGGLYWPGKMDRRDHVRGHDANERHKQEIADEIASRVLKALELDPETVRTRIESAIGGDSEKATNIIGSLGLDLPLLPKIQAAAKATRLLDITEFGRAVHAEMDAILSCARAGIGTRDATIYSTTFHATTAPNTSSQLASNASSISNPTRRARHSNCTAIPSRSMTTARFRVKNSRRSCSSRLWGSAHAATSTSSP